MTIQLLQAPLIKRNGLCPQGLHSLEIKSQTLKKEERNNALTHDGTERKRNGTSEKQKNTEVRASQTMTSQVLWHLKEEDGLENGREGISQSRQEEWPEQGLGVGQFKAGLGRKQESISKVRSLKYDISQPETWIQSNSFHLIC